VSLPPATPADEPEVKVPAAVRNALGEKAVAILSGATKVEAFRLEKQPAATPGKDTIGMDGLQWRIKARGKDPGAGFAARVRDLLLDEAAVQPSGAGGARGWVALRLWKGKESVTVVIDFEGRHLYVTTRDGENKQVKAALGGFLLGAKGELDDGTLFGRVRALALEAFPEDAEIKALGP
jgi:hypothetical protein